jgi:hypothetical protein
MTIHKFSTKIKKQSQVEHLDLDYIFVDEVAMLGEVFYKSSMMIKKVRTGKPRRRHAWVAFELGLRSLELPHLLNRKASASFTITPTPMHAVSGFPAPTALLPASP